MVNHVVNPNSAVDPSLWPSMAKMSKATHLHSGLHLHSTGRQEAVTSGGHGFAAFQSALLGGLETSRGERQRTFVGADFCWLFMMYPYLPWFILIRCCSYDVLWWDVTWNDRVTFVAGFAETLYQVRDMKFALHIEIPEPSGRSLWMDVL
jgi:hypothetical protein